MFKDFFARFRSVPEFVREEVSAGAAILDLLKPHWAELIDRKTLDTGSVFHCPLAQVYGSYGKGTTVLWNNGRLTPYGLGFARAYASDETPWSLYDRAWKDEIAERLV